MTPADIIAAIQQSGATITTDGMTISIKPLKLVPPMVMDAARATKPALVAELLASGRLHGTEGAEAAVLAARLTKGLPLVEAIEARGIHESQEHGHFERLLHGYERACDAAHNLTIPSA
jgi:hypothetical protein